MALSALVPVALAADDREAQAEFAAGTAHVAAGDYTAALDAFLAARDAGLTGPAVHHNIGVCAWMLGDLDLAESAFLATAGFPAMAPLAHYNLGLVAQQRDEPAAAQAWFELAFAGSGDDAVLRQLAQAQLGAYSPQPESSGAPPGFGPPYGFFSAAAGYDSNVGLVADGELLGVSDLGSPYGELQAVVLLPLPRDFSIRGGFYHLEYFDLPELDQTGAQLELLFSYRLGDWGTQFGAGYNLNRLDGERFDDQRTLMASAYRWLNDEWDARLQLRYADIEGRAPYEGLSGDWGEFSLRLRRHLDQQRWQIEYRFETNDRASPELSPDRHRVDVEWRLPLARRIELTTALGWRRSRYSTPGMSWSERSWIAAAGFAGPLAGAWEWVLRYDWLDNDSSLPEFEYRRNRAFAGLRAAF
jgi:tetratricopeptide (TPR) repeat protein